MSKKEYKYVPNTKHEAPSEELCIGNNEYLRKVLIEKHNIKTPEVVDLTKVTELLSSIEEAVWGFSFEALDGETLYVGYSRYGFNIETNTEGLDEVVEASLEETVAFIVKKVQG